MSRRGKGRDVHGVVLLDKPAGLSSSRAVQKVRWLFEARKAGHTGSLDPFATGMLPICLGEASKTAGFMLDASKTYVAEARLGQATRTGDPEGEVVAEAPVPGADRAPVQAALAKFEGRIRQVPPMYSALKHQGQRLYKLARAGQEVPREAREVTVHSLRLLNWEPPLLVFRVHCSKGTYVRTLAEDIARELGSCAHLVALRRLAVEPFREEDMVGLEQLAAMREAGTLQRCLLPPDAGLQDWPVVTLGQAQAERFGHGGAVEAAGAGVEAGGAGVEAGGAGAPGLVRVYGPAGLLLGLGEIDAAGRLSARRVFNLEAGLGV
jgi:tRNA pseudouridine55 synthase